LLLDATNQALDEIEFPISDWSKIKYIFEKDFENSSLFDFCFKDKDSHLTNLQFTYDILVNYIVCHEHVLHDMKET